MVHRRLMVGLVALVTMLSGCAGGGTTNPSLGGGEDGGEGANVGSNAIQLLRFDGDPANSTLHANGTFEAGPNCGPTSCGQRMDAHDVTERVSNALLTLVRATLVVEGDTANPAASVSLSLETNDARTIQWQSEQTDQGASLYAVLVRNAEPIAVQVIDASLVRSADVTYSLVVDFVVDPTLVFPAAPVEVTLSANQTVSMVAVPDLARDPSTPGGVGAIVYDPADRPILRVQGSIGGVDVTIPAEAASGPYVLLVAGGIPVRAETEGVENSMRLVPLQIEEGERRDVAGQGGATWDFTLTEPPVSVGVRVVYEGAWAPGTEETAVRLTGPTGLLIEESPGPGGFGVGVTSTYSYSTGYGREGVTAGDYTVDYQSGHATPTSTYEFVVTLDR